MRASLLLAIALCGCSGIQANAQPLAKLIFTGNVDPFGFGGNVVAIYPNSNGITAVGIAPGPQTVPKGCASAATQMGVFNFEPGHVYEATCDKDSLVIREVR